MKVFVSWSGETSHRVARAFADWIPDVIQRAAPFISSGIPKGTRWSGEVAKGLQDTSFGIICVTKDNLAAPWLLFEAGAISREIATSRLVPLLIDVSKGKLSGNPLSQFQMCDFTKIEVFSLVKSLNESSAEERIEEDRLQRSFDAFWPRLEESISDLLLNPVAGDEHLGSSGPDERVIAVDTAEAESPLDKSAVDFESSATVFKDSESFREDSPYWTAAIAARRQKLGLPKVGKGLEEMLEDDPQAFWPNLFIARQHLEQEDVQGAKSKIGLLTKRVGSRQARAYSDILLDLSAKRQDYKEALSELKVIVADNIPSDIKASAIEAFTSRKPGSENGLNGSILREEASRLNPSLWQTRFNLAHQLAGERGLEYVALYQYNEVASNDARLKTNSSNNRGVIFSGKGLPAPAMMFFGEAIHSGNALALANVADNLTRGGFLEQAAKLLENANEEGEHGANIKKARNNLKLATEKQGKDVDAAAVRAKDDQGKFAHFANVCVKSWAGGANLTGKFAAASGEIVVQVTGNSGIINVKGDSKPLSGELVFNGLCFEASLHEEGSRSGALSKRVLMSSSIDEQGACLLLLFGGVVANQPLEQFTLARQIEAEAETK